MNKKLTAILCVLLITSAVVTASLAAAFQNREKDNSLLLKEHNGAVTLFKGNEIVKVYDTIVISVLPSSDQNRLRNGIKIEDEEQLSAIIEDYDG
ncbi:MAG: BofC C-terminal domain-containing protein [Clostridia bacterium]|nr:BofC C-terminal domain-containing protein [Clostridia bacterium]